MAENTNLNTNIWADPKIIETIARGGVVVMPTDTIYGIMCSALDAEAVQRVYEVRHRAPEKPCIILIKDFSEVEKFGVVLSEAQRDYVAKINTPTSVILDCDLEKFKYLHRGTKTLAFRVPQNIDLVFLLNQTGPLIAPSANTEGGPVSKDTTEARAYFSDKVDLYIDAGPVVSQPSRVVRLKNDGSVEILRP